MMQNLQTQLNVLKASFSDTQLVWRLVVSIFGGMSLSNIVWLYFLQWPFITFSRVFAIIIGTLIFSFVIYIFLVFSQKRAQAQNINLMILGLFCLAFSILLYFSLGLDPVSNVLFTPESTLSIRPGDQANPRSKGKRILVDFMETELALITSGSEISFSQFFYSSDWQRDDSKLVFESGEISPATWIGRAGKELSITFSTGPDSGRAVISLNGAEQPVDLFSLTQGKLNVVFQIPETMLDRSTGLVSICFTMSLILFVVSLLFLTFSMPAKPLVKNGKYTWLVYTLPLILSWFIYLLAFWPGLLSQDSINQWDQVINFQFRSAHPPFHTILIWVASQISNTPTTFLAFQILIQAVVIAWGLKVFREIGVPAWVNWLILVIFSLSPVIGMMIITLWKDIPYSTALFALTIMMIQIVFSQGQWLKKTSAWIWLGLVAAMASLFRHNGLGVAILLFPTLIIFYKKLAKYTLFAFVTFFTTYAMINYFLFPVLEVEKETGFSNITFLHQIAAHVHHETPLKPSEQDYLESLLPINEWNQKYDPCTVNTIMFHDDFDIDRFFHEDINKPFQVFIAVLSRRPLVSFKHILTSGSLVWRIKPLCRMYYSPFDKYYYEYEPYWQVKWVLKNGFGLIEDSKLPFVADFLGNQFFRTKEMLIFWRPAISLFLILYALMIVSLKYRSIKILLIGSPAIFQSLLLLLVNISQDFRYQLSVYMIGIFLIGLLFFYKKKT